MSRKFWIEADGGSRGNPGVSAGGAVLIDGDTGRILAECGEYLGVATNNVAEYSGLVVGLRAAISRDSGAQIRVRMDSKLVIEQLSGRWKIKHPDMKVLAQQVRELSAAAEVQFEWIPRSENSRADALANECMDRKESFVRDIDGWLPASEQVSVGVPQTLFD